MPKSKGFPKVPKVPKEFPRVPKNAQECPSQAWGLPFKGSLMFILNSMVMLSIITEFIHMLFP